MVRTLTIFMRRNKFFAFFFSKVIKPMADRTKHPKIFSFFTICFSYKLCPLEGLGFLSTQLMFTFVSTTKNIFKPMMNNAVVSSFSGSFRKAATLFGTVFSFPTPKFLRRHPIKLFFADKTLFPKTHYTALMVTSMGAIFSFSEISISFFRRFSKGLFAFNTNFIHSIIV